MTKTKSDKKENVLVLAKEGIVFLIGWILVPIMSANAASIMHAIGVLDQYIMRRGGWSSDKTLKAIYRDTH